MRTHWQHRRHFTLVLWVGAAACCVLSASGASAASIIYYCPDRGADQLISATPGPGCVPLAEKKDEDQSTQGRPRHDYRVENLEHDVSAFLTRYRRFLECCKTDLSELREVEQLGEEVSDLLISVQANLSNNALASRGIMLRELIPRVAKARSDLRTLRARLEEIDELSVRREQLGFDKAGRESRRIRDLEESIERDIHAPPLPESARTGASIGVAPAAGPAIGRSSKTGSDIGREGLTGQNIGSSPKNSREIGVSGPTGFEIGATGRAGPAVGESSLNQETSSNVGSTLQRSTVGSTIPDSTVGSSINSSTIGSDMSDTSVGSSLKNSPPGSSLPNR